MLTDTEITDHAAAIGVSPAMLLPKSIDRVFYAVRLNWPNGFGRRA